MIALFEGIPQILIYTELGITTDPRLGRYR